MGRGIKHDFVLDEDEFGEFCVIPVSGGRYFAKVDAEDFELVAYHRWGAHRCGELVYASRWFSSGGKRKHVKMHRAIMGIRDCEIFIDHRNGNGLDNRRGNLRVATRSENIRNQVRRVGGTSRYKGVCWNKRNGQWRVMLGYGGKKVWVGYFPRKIIDGVDSGEIEAARAYDRAAMKYFGVFAKLNFEGKDMAYVLNKDEIKRASALVKELNSREGMTINAWLMGQSVADLELLCRYVGCNVSRLAGQLEAYAHNKGVGVGESTAAK